MATPDSTAAGYLQPDPGASYDADLQDIFQQMCSKLCDLPGEVVRPRWQMNPGNRLPQAENWVAYGLTLASRDWDATQYHDPAYNNGQGANVIERTEVWHCTYSFFGSNCDLYATLMQDGLSVTQNRDELEAQGIKFVEFLEPVPLPALLKDVWNRRLDLKGVFRRRVKRVYPIRTIAKADVSVNNEDFVDTIHVSP